MEERRDALKKNNKEKIAFLFLLSFFFCGSLEVEATATDLGGTGTVKVEKSSKTAVVDPENTETIVKPEKGHSTEGSLRIDYVSDWNFGKVTMTKQAKEDVYYLNAETFLNSNVVRGSYIQITDQREEAKSWTLQVKQNGQFRNPVIQEQEDQELVGAVFSLDKIWVNTIGNQDLPTVSRDAIAFQNFNQAYNLANLEKEKGKAGTWLIVFGASADNTSNQENTLKPIVDGKGKTVIDEVAKKPLYSNQAISIKIPKSTKIHPVTYETTFTWILGAFP